MSRKQIAIFSCIFFAGIGIVATALMPNESPNQPNNTGEDTPTNMCNLRIKNNTQLQQPITVGTVNQSAETYSAISLPNGSWGSLSVSCDVLANMSQKLGMEQILSRNSKTTYILELPPVNTSQAPKMPPISRLVLGQGAKSQIFLTSPNSVCVLPSSLCQ